MNALVVPTNSPRRLEEFLRAWSPWPWDLVVVIRDGPDADLTVPEQLVPPASRGIRSLSGLRWSITGGRPTRS